MTRNGSKSASNALFDDIFLQALDECDYVVLFGLRHLELRKGRSGVSEKHVPVALADPHATMGHGKCLRNRLSAPSEQPCRFELTQASDSVALGLDLQETVRATRSASRPCADQGDGTMGQAWLANVRMRRSWRRSSVSRGSWKLSIHSFSTIPSRAGRSC